MELNNIESMLSFRRSAATEESLNNLNDLSEMLHYVLHDRAYLNSIESMLSFRRSAAIEESLNSRNKYSIHKQNSMVEILRSISLRSE